MRDKLLGLVRTAQSVYVDELMRMARVDPQGGQRSKRTRSFHEELHTLVEQGLIALHDDDGSPHVSYIPQPPTAPYACDDRLRGLLEIADATADSANPKRPETIRTVALLCIASTLGAIEQHLRARAAGEAKADYPLDTDGCSHCLDSSGTCELCGFDAIAASARLADLQDTLQDIDDRWIDGTTTQAELIGETRRALRASKVHSG